jgi:hypothetical protein
MQLVGLSFQNYKAFPARESLEIRPLTVLIGRNSSGKSAIARMPMLLAGALSDRAEAPVELDVDGVDFGASFLDLIHNRRPHGAIGLGATYEHDGERFDLQAKVQHYDDVKVQVVAELELKTGKGRCSFSRIGTDPLEDPAQYRIEVAGHPAIERPLAFRGVRPAVIPTASWLGVVEEEVKDGLHHVFTVLSQMRNTFDATGYLGPFREAPQRLYRYPGGLPQSVGRNGAQAPALLGADALRRGGRVLAAVGDWYKNHLGRWALDVARQGDTFSLVLRSPDDASVEVNLADVGTGLSQVLPLIVQRQFESVTGTREDLEIVEQPELHLHPGAHGDLADLYIEAAKQAGTRFLIETHSENFILRIRRRVAEGKLDAERVRLYWVDDEPRPGSHVKTIEILRTGEVSAWPKGVFSEDYEETKAIRKAQRAPEGAR